MAQERDAKLRRLEAFRRRLPAVSASALSSICKDIADHGIPDVFSRQNLQHARELIASTSTPFGSLLQNMTVRADGDIDMQVEIAHPFAVIWHAFSTCDAFRALMVAKHMARPSSLDQPWSLILYSDEVTPGNALAADPSRKSQCIYYSFAELGHAALAREDTWLTATVLRSERAREAQGGMAQIIGCLLKVLFPARGTHLLDTGIQLVSEDGQALRLHARLTTIVQDGAAHKDVWKCRDGTRMCMACNAVAFGTDLDQYDPSMASNVIRDEGLEFTTDDAVRDKATRLNAFKAVQGVTAFQRTEMVIGFTWSPYNILCDPALQHVVKPVTQQMHDFMHGLFSSGVFNITLNCLLEVFEQSGLRTVYQQLSDYIEGWRWPGRVHNSTLHKIFEVKRRKGNREGGSFRCQASECLSVYPVLAFWVCAVISPSLVAGRARDASSAFLAFADMADVFMSVARGGATPELLRDAVHGFLAAFVRVWGFERLTPKYHWLLHYARELRTHGSLFACWVHERKHKSIRRYANPVQNTRDYDHTVLAEVTSHHIAALRAPHALRFQRGLVYPRKPPARVQSVIAEALGLDDPSLVEGTCIESRHNDFETCRKRDVVVVKVSSNGWVVGEVWMHLCICSIHVSLVSTWTLKQMSSETRSAEWIVRDHPELFATSDIITSLIWTPLGHDAVRTLVPSDLF